MRRAEPSAWLTERKGREKEKATGGRDWKKKTQPPPPIGGKEREEPSKDREGQEGRGEKDMEEERGKIMWEGQGGNLGMGNG